MSKKRGRESFAGPACHRRFPSVASDWNIAFPGGALDSCSESPPMEPAKFRWEMSARK